MSERTEKPDTPPRGEGRGASFTDASYIPRDEAPNVPRVYTPAAPREEKEKTSRRFSGGAVAALCVLCFLLGLWVRDLRQREDPSATEAFPTPPPERTATGVPALTSAPDPTAFPVLSAPEIYTLACEQVVGVTTADTENNAFGAPSENAVAGAGCVLTADGYILTSYHGIRPALETGAEVLVRFFDGQTLPAQVAGYEKDVSDIAVLKVDAAGLRPVIPGDVRAMAVGETVYTVGHPLGEMTYTLTPGMISAAEREIAAGSGESAVNLFQVSAGGRGGAGSPVYNQRGEVVGLVTTRYGAGDQGPGLAVPMTEALALAEDIMENGYVRGKPYLGIIVQTVTSAVADYYNQFYEDCMVVGAQVFAMDNDGAAALAGVQRGDIITALDGKPIAAAADLTAAEKEYRAGDGAVLTVYRGKEYLELPVVFGERSPDAAPDAGW